MELLILLVAGAAVGVIAGLLGIGGGALIVPVLAFLFERRGVTSDVLMQCAIGTSLATIVFTSMASMRAHHRRGGIRWPVFRQLAPGIVAGTLAGAVIADALSGAALKLLFGIFLIIVAIEMARGATTDARRALPGRVGMTAAGGVIGVLSALFGIGGGAISVPFMTWCSVRPREAVATAAACGFPIAVAGTLGYIISGMNETGLPPMSIGYVVLPAFGAITLGSVLFAPLGVSLAHRISERWLRRIFALLLVALGLRMMWS